MCVSAVWVYADVVADAQALINSGDFSAATEIIEAELERSPKSKQAGMLNQLLGECKFEFGDYDGAEACFNIAKNRGVADAYRFLGRLNYFDYDFTSAAGNYAKYRQMKTRAKKTVATEASHEEDIIIMAENFLERVEKIAVIDSLTVDASDFYKAYKLPASAGSLYGPEIIPFGESRAEAEVAFMNEGKNFIMWAEPDSAGNVSLFESIKLTDGSWHSPVMESEILRGGGNADYPFMMSDGLTLYFANDGKESLGGYDIFVATRDAVTGEYMQPQNMGMPYNSPYDDFMLAIDEQNGVGWWATDRNRIDGKLTIYVFVPNETRTNYNSDDDDVVSFARIDNIKSTQGGNDYSELLEAIENIRTGETERKADFYFTVKAGKTYTTLDDFKNPQARATMIEYLDEMKLYGQASARLSDMRKRYAAERSTTLAEKIIKAESLLERQRERIRDMKNMVYKSEKDNM